MGKTIVAIFVGGERPKREVTKLCLLIPGFWNIKKTVIKNSRNFSTWQPLEDWELCVSSKTQEWHQRKSYHFEISKPEHFLWLKAQHLKSPKHPRRSLPCIGGFETMEYGITHLSE